MSYDEMLDEAMNELSVDTDADCVPIISEHLLDILERCRVALVWEAETAYVYGDVVQLDGRNGHRYRCITAGTTGATAPSWPLRAYYSVTDGTVDWEECGVDIATSTRYTM